MNLLFPDVPDWKLVFQQIKNKFSDSILEHGQYTLFSLSEAVQSLVGSRFGRV